MVKPAQPSRMTIWSFLNEQLIRGRNRDSANLGVLGRRSTPVRVHAHPLRFRLSRRDESENAVRTDERRGDHASCDDATTPKQSFCRHLQLLDHRDSQLVSDWPYRKPRLSFIFATAVVTLILLLLGLWDARRIRRSHGACASRDIGLMASQRLLVWVIALSAIDIALIPAARALAIAIVTADVVLMIGVLFLRRQMHGVAHDLRAASTG